MHGVFMSGYSEQTVLLVPYTMRRRPDLMRVITFRLDGRFEVDIIAFSACDLSANPSAVITCFVRRSTARIAPEEIYTCPTHFAERAALSDCVKCESTEPPRCAPAPPSL